MAYLDIEVSQDMELIVQGESVGELSKSNQLIIALYNDGFRVTFCGEHVYNNETLVEYPLYAGADGYKKFMINISKFPEFEQWVPVKASKLQAFCKYGAYMFIPGTQVRHVNSRKEDDSFGNIAIGTAKMNARDRRYKDLWV